MTPPSTKAPARSLSLLSQMVESDTDVRFSMVANKDTRKYGDGKAKVCPTAATLELRRRVTERLLRGEKDLDRPESIDIGRWSSYKFDCTNSYAIVSLSAHLHTLNPQTSQSLT